jgi:DNA modification methylase
MNIEDIVNTNLLGKNAEVLKTFPDNCIDLTVTSPPYDNMRSYKGKIDEEVDYNGYSFPFEDLAKELWRVTKDGGVVVWVVADGTTPEGGETGTSFRQALYFQSLGFTIHDTMIYEKNGAPFPSKNRYYQVFEYMFVFSKGKPNTANLLKDRKNKWAGCSNWGRKTHRGKDDELVETEGYVVADVGVRFNIWKINNGKGFTTKDEDAFAHPAMFPEKLAEDHILSWSNEGDIVLDPFMGSGTTAKMAYLNKRKWIGIDINEEYCKIIEQRIKKAKREVNLEDNIFDELAGP